MMSEDKILVSNIQRCSLHDGSGIRTTVFLKGCNLHCPWCANPENIERNNQFWFDEDKCIGTDRGCILNKECSFSIASEKAGSTVPDVWSGNKCGIHALQAVSKKYPAKELEKELLKDRLFWGENGGITFSGGEPLLQINALSSVLDSLKSKGISICFETALFVSGKSVEICMRYADELFIDMKCLDDKACRQYLGGDLKIYLKNLKVLEAASIPYVLRIPLIKPYTYTDCNLRKIFLILSTLHPLKVEIFSCHNLGNKKYRMCGKKEPFPCNNITVSEIDVVANEIRNLGKTVSILRI